MNAYRPRPDREERLASAIKAAGACVVTVAEHKRLTELSRARPDLEGWDRYEAAGIEVVDRGEVT